MATTLVLVDQQQAEEERSSASPTAAAASSQPSSSLSVVSVNGGGGEEPGGGGGPDNNNNHELIVSSLRELAGEVADNAHSAVLLLNDLLNYDKVRTNVRTRCAVLYCTNSTYPEFNNKHQHSVSASVLYYFLLGSPGPCGTDQFHLISQSTCWFSPISSFLINPSYSPD